MPGGNGKKENNMFPLAQRKIGGYVFSEKTAYSSFHLGTDYTAKLDKLHAPFAGRIVKQYFDKYGGQMIHFKPDHDDVIIRFLHLDKFLKPIGWVRTGEVMAITGKTGLGVVNGAANYQGVYHLHI